MNILIPHLICIGSAEPSCPVDMCVGPIRISKCWISPVPWAGAVVLHCISYSCCFESMSAQWADVNLMERSRKEPKTLAFSKEQKPFVTQNSIPDQSFRHTEQQDCPFSNESFTFWPAKNEHIHTLTVSCPPELWKRFIIPLKSTEHQKHPGHYLRATRHNSPRRRVWAKPQIRKRGWPTYQVRSDAGLQISKNFLFAHASHASSYISPLTQLAQAGFFAFMLYSDIFRPNPAPSAPLVQMDFAFVMNLATLTPEASISSFSRRDISHLWGKAKKQARNKLDMVLVISFKVNPSHGDAAYLIIILNSLMFSRTRYRICRSKSEVQY